MIKTLGVLGIEHPREHQTVTCHVRHSWNSLRKDAVSSGLEMELQILSHSRESVGQQPR